jgi:hypothetical protein
MLESSRPGTHTILTITGKIIGYSTWTMLRKELSIMEISLHLGKHLPKKQVRHTSELTEIFLSQLCV